MRALRFLYLLLATLVFTASLSADSNPSPGATAAVTAGAAAAAAAVAAAEEQRMNNLAAGVDAEDRAVLRRVSELLKNGNRFPIVIPPDSPMDCVSREQAQQMANPAIEEYVRQVNGSDADAIAQILEIARKYSLLSQDRGDVLSLCSAFLDRMILKAGRAMTTYRAKPVKYLAVSALAVRTIKIFSLLKDPEGTASSGKKFWQVEDELLKECGEFAYSMIKPLLSRISTEHALDLGGWVITMRRDAELDGYVPPESFEALESRIKNALRFKLELELTNVTYAGQNNFIRRAELYVLPDLSVPGTGAKPMQAKRKGLTLEGTGKSDYSWTDWDDPNAHSEVPEMSNTSASFNVDISGFQPCEGTASVGVDRFYSPNESFYFVKAQKRTSGNQMGIWQAYFTKFMDHESGLYTFPITEGKVHNHAELVIEETFAEQMDQAGADPSVHVDFKITLKHSPR
jgi:hypothetical protein